jgi:hypothetical protein
LPDWTKKARIRFGWSVIISSAMVLGDSSAAMYSRPVISERSPSERPHSG